MIEIIFWYTGALVWGIIGLLFLLAVVIGIFVAYFRSEKTFRKMYMLHLIGRRGMSEKDALKSREYIETYGIPKGCDEKDFWHWLECHQHVCQRGQE